MPPILRWLIGLLVLLGSANAAAHPLLEDPLSVILHADRVELEVRARLRSVIVSSGAAPQQGSYFTPSEVATLVRAHAGYLAQHLFVRVNEQLLTAGETQAELVEPITQPVHEHVDLDRYQARFSLPYAHQGKITRLSLEQNVSSDASSDPGWRVTYVVSVRNAGDPTLLASGLLTRERGLDLTLPEAGARRGTRDIPQDLAGYFLVGLRHILHGWDHLLFVSALVLATRRWLELVKIILAFTIAHSLTLTLAVLHVVQVPAAIVESLIALSIMVVSLENLVRPTRGASKARLAVAFGFGLVHGLGFAGPLVDALHGAPREVVALGIVGFSAGVELGHQLVVLPLFALVTALARTHRDRSLSIALRLGSLATACGGAAFLIRALEAFVIA